MRDAEARRRRHLRAVRRQLAPQPKRRRRRPRRALLWGALLVAAVLGVGAARSWLGAEAAPAVVELTSGAVEAAYEVDGLVVRQELVVRAPMGGRVQRLAQEGERVRVGAPVVEMVQGGAGEEAADEAADPGDGATAGPGPGTDQDPDPAAIQRQLDDLSEQIYALAVAVNAARDQGDAAEMARLQAELDRVALRQAELAAQLGGAVVPPAPAPGGDGGAADRAAALPAVGGVALARVSAAMAGVLVYQTDGLEGALRPDGQEEWSPAWFRSLPPPDPRRTGEGRAAKGEPLFKVVDNLSLSLLALLPSEALADLAPDGRAELRLEEQEQPIPVRVAVLREEGGEALVQLTAPLLPEEWTAVRRVRGQLVLARYEGLIAPRTALDVRDGLQGVWVKPADGDPIFRPARVLGGNRELVALETEIPPGTAILRVAPATTQ